MHCVSPNQQCQITARDLKRIHDNHRISSTRPQPFFICQMSSERSPQHFTPALKCPIIRGSSLIIESDEQWNWVTDLSLLCLILVILGKQMRQNVATAAGDMNERTFLAETETSRDWQHHTNRLHYQSPLAKIATNDEATQYCLYLCAQQ